MSKDDPFLITTELLQHRLNAGLGIAGGSRGSLTKCAALIYADGEADAVVHDELQLQQVEMTKLVLTLERNQEEIDQLKNNVPTASAADSTDVIELRNELQLVQQVKSCLEEYEALAKLTVNSHAVSEYQLQSELQGIQQKHEKAVEDLQKAEAECKIRQGQFHLLQQCLQDLKQSLSQPLDLQPHELEQVADAMEVDEITSSKEERSDEDGELYGDL